MTCLTHLRLAILLCGCVFANLCGPGLSAELPEYQPVRAELIRPRDGLGNVLAKLRAGGEVKIAYLGGSITAASGWRVMSRAWFAQQYPQAQVSEINAAIGGTGSDLGVFRLHRDALADHPDLLFVSRDGVHPLDAGHQIYTEVLAEAVRQMQAVPQAVDHGSKLDTCFVPHHWEAAKMVPLTPAMLSGNWKPLSDDQSLAKNFGHRLGQLWEADQPGSRVAFRFRGSQAKLYDLLGPDGGQVVVTVDGQTRERPVPRFDSYCTYHRLATLGLADGLDPEQVHSVSVEIHPEQPDRSPVAFRLQNPDEELQSPKYQGTYVRAGQILLLGELAD